jgi:hypothetical protein
MRPRSNVRPRRRARSIMLSATTNGTRRRASSPTSIRCRLRLVASTTTIAAPVRHAVAGGQRLRRDARLGQVELEAVEAGQVDHLERRRCRRRTSPDLHAPAAQVGRGAGEVRRLGAQAAQPVEQRRLAGVGVAEQQDASRCVTATARGADESSAHRAPPVASTTTCSRAATLRARPMRVVRTSTMHGSPHTRTTSRLPVTRPIACSRHASPGSRSPACSRAGSPGDAARRERIA